MMVLACSGTAWAYTTYAGHVLNGGVGDYGSNPRLYYITSSVGSYSNEVTDCVYTWIHTTSRLGITTPIYWTRTYTQSASVLDWYHLTYFDSDTGIIGLTEMVLNNQVVSPYLTNWNWAKIKLNVPVFDPLSDFNEEGSCAHEMGHAMGLGHTSVTNRVMCLLENGRTVNACQADDANGINYLY
jgi:hypothetical protein